MKHVDFFKTYFVTTQSSVEFFEVGTRALPSNASINALNALSLSLALCQEQTVVSCQGMPGT